MVEAAGGLVVVGGGGRRLVLVVHRPRYDDWSFPKGKLDPGEDHLDAALREVLEETGLRCTPGRELDEVRYTDHRGRPKRVRYWVMTPDPGSGPASEGVTPEGPVGVGHGGGAPEGAGHGTGPFVPNDEVDRVRWSTPSEAADLLTYPHDVALLGQIEH